MSAADPRSRWGLHTASSLRLRAKELGATDYLIKELLPARSIALLVGDSGLGKSPFVYQAGLCVATGLPFLGYETRKGRVLIVDFENGIADMGELADQLSRHLGLPMPPEDTLHFWTVNDCRERFGRERNTVFDMIRDLKPALVIVDSLSSFRPEAEEKISLATNMLQEFRDVIRDTGTAVFLVHHRRKQPRKADEGAGPLESANLRRWFEDCRGSSSLINGSDIRLGVDEPAVGPVVGKDEAAIVMRGFGRLRGDIGPIYVTRDTDEDGQVLGYRKLSGAELLFNPLQQAALEALPSSFRFKVAKQTYKHADQATSNFLQRCIDIGLVRKTARGQYERVVESTQGAQSSGESGEEG
jgi:archaellum biogenesis ATPase FlaH